MFLMRFVWRRRLTGERVLVIFQGWLWRIVVDDIIGGPGDQPHWSSYNELLRVIERESKYFFRLPSPVSRSPLCPCLTC
jgi:hypothetical protein